MSEDRVASLSSYRKEQLKGERVYGIKKGNQWFDPSDHSFWNSIYNTTAMTLKECITAIKVHNLW